MNKVAVLIAGCGDVGSALGRQLLAGGHTVYGLRRTINQLPEGIHGIPADLAQADSLQQLPAADILVFSAAASEHSEDGYRQTYLHGLDNLLKALTNRPRHVFFTSSSGVYHQNDHSWVDESSVCQPSRFSGQLMLEAEQRLLNAGLPATVVRFSGIYGPGRERLLNTVRSGRGAPAEPLSYSNRIHRDDCAGVLAHLIGMKLHGETLAPIYLASDDRPASLHEVTEWLAGQLGVEITDYGFGRFSGSKRCSNQLLKSTGYRFKYPSYREGYGEMIEEMR
ncbi:SDR family oxidoreductase [Marinobacterium arenosum]|uniref:SDR family oxidoreductase n=1 Tax=Marinobacterium arenosum TaxID=2862496 RepID=UPI001C944703|nr:SDR family oxidoreductase [Marinobacterium arenosum]MBY4678642.1 SDR family oxidoreductase [Marinobacterium arenosum]